MAVGGIPLSMLSETSSKVGSMICIMAPESEVARRSEKSQISEKRAVGKVAPSWLHLLAYEGSLHKEIAKTIPPCYDDSSQTVTDDPKPAKFAESHVDLIWTKDSSNASVLSNIRH